jgi:hypothetical protein
VREHLPHPSVPTLAATVALAQSFVNLTLDDRTASVLRVLPAASSFVLADGTTSVAATSTPLRGGTGDEPAEFEPGEVRPMSLIPAESVQGGGVIAPMCPWPLTAPTTVVVTVALEVNGAVRTLERVFSSDGPSEP